MTMPPIIITCRTRRSIIDGDRVILQKLCNRKKPKGVWPETAVAEPVRRLYAAHAWAIKGFIDDDFAGVPKGRVQ